jgi:acyl carrier protein
MELFVECSVRRLVADHLGVGLEELVAGVSLREDLAADSLDLVELAMMLEAEFGIAVPERILDRVRTYGDLVQATGLLIRARRAAEARAAEPPLRMWARVVPPAGESAGTLERAGWLTPYAAETIAEDAVRAGHGTRLEVTVAAGTDDIGFARVRHHFTWLRERDVRVTVRRDDPPAVQPVSTHPVLDPLTGAPTKVTVADYVDPLTATTSSR